jgi:hypothetical protein
MNCIEWRDVEIELELKLWKESQENVKRENIEKDKIINDKLNNYYSKLNRKSNNFNRKEDWKLEDKKQFYSIINNDSEIVSKQHILSEILIKNNNLLEKEKIIINDKKEIQQFKIEIDLFLNENDLNNNNNNNNLLLFKDFENEKYYFELEKKTGVYDNIIDKDIKNIFQIWFKNWSKEKKDKFNEKHRSKDLNSLLYIWTKDKKWILFSNFLKTFEQDKLLKEFNDLKLKTMEILSDSIQRISTLDNVSLLKKYKEELKKKL